jgi:anti-sigma regulatory factor (Ser/Thr protein kinase)
MGELAYDEGGRGLFIIWRFLDQFHVSIKPGKETVIGGHVRVTSPLDLDEPKGFHISAL